MKRLFGQYVSKDVYDQLVNNPALARLGGQRRQMTVLFSDIRGFTSISEKGEPEDIVQTLNEYFTRMVDIVFKHKGTLDKFVGDMVMALFGAPLDDVNHAEHAVDAALEMIVELNRLNEQWIAEGRPALDIGIGINTGPMIAGNIGSEAIMSYTVIGDAVNLGSRLESLNKQYSTRIIISDATRAALPDRYIFRPLGDVVVKGKTRPVAIFEVVGPAPSQDQATPSAPPQRKRGALMKLWIIVAMLAVSSPAYAQFGGLLNKAQKAQEQKQKFDDLNITEQEEIEIGADVSLKIRQRFGVVQDPAVHKYVALVGTLVAQQTERPKLPWTFIVLDTDGVNAFASPGGFVHITRGALALIKSEAELAGVLGHEMTHVAHKHTVNAITKNKAVQLGTNETLVRTRPVPGPAREQDLRNGAGELLRSRGRARCGQRGGRARPEGRLRAGGAGRFPDAPRGPQQGSGGEERPVRLASGIQRADRQGPPAGWLEDRPRWAPLGTPRRSRIRRPRSRRLRSSSKDRPVSRDRATRRKKPRKPRSRKSPRRKASVLAP